MGEKSFDKIIGILFPRRCPVCGEIVMPKGNMICPPCKKKVKLVKEPRCKKCGKCLVSEETEYCYDCVRKNHSYETGISLFEYDDVMKQSIYGFKYKNKREYADYYIEEL
ncbi:MAG: ComF family protein, partial [Clostridiales bacterium]|nr:ComF family protein [Clostridiales bacterium]